MAEQQDDRSHSTEPAANPSREGCASGEDQRTTEYTRTSADAAGEHTSPDIHVVGICAGASAEDSISELLAGLPATGNLAYVLVAHPAPEAGRVPQPERLATRAAIPAQRIESGEALRPNRAHIVPPGLVPALDGRIVRISEPSSGTVGGARSHAAIDVFLRSLARTCGPRAVGVVLSGTGAHGSIGLREIKDHGGMTLVQAPETAEFPQMPQSAIESGLADRVLTPAGIAAALSAYSRDAAARPSEQQDSPDEQELDRLAAVLAQIRARTKYDFRYYRKNMLLRRVRRRMGLARLVSQNDYLQLLRRDPDEVKRLVGDMLIGVTSFFRDPGAFEVLSQRVLDSLLHDEPRVRPIRIWVPGCASGEEAYSIAILMLEAFAKRERAPELQIFATDVSESALRRAREGRYPKSIEADVGAERLSRFFLQAGETHYRVNKQLRESVVFAPQNLITDAPFSKLDLISCRNLLIYLQPEVQRKIIELFQFALCPGGYLLLGPSESVGQNNSRFETVSKRWRLYRHTDMPHLDRERFALPSAPLMPQLPPPLPMVKQPTDQDPSAVAQRLLLDEHGPAAVLINRRYEILYFFGPTADYLDLPSGRPTLDLMTMARQGLRTRLRAACHKALRNNCTVRVDDARIARGGGFVPVAIHVRPMPQRNAGEELLLVSFVERGAAPSGNESGETADAAPTDSALAQQLEQELKATRDDLQSSIEDLELANEELKASNEEAMSMNEELQSANEELETSKEELQSLNEELSTLNAQLEEKVQELEHSNNDINNLLASTEIATVFLDPVMRIKRFTPGSSRLLNLRVSDIGRPLRDLSPNIRDDDLIGDAEQVLERLVPREKEISGDRDTHYLRRILPYRTEDNRIEGVVIAFIDVTQKTRAEAANRASEARFRMLFERSPMCLMEQDWSGVKGRLAALASAAGEALPDWVESHPDRAAGCREHIAVKTINRAALALLGAESDEEVTSAVSRFLPMQPIGAFMASLQDLLQGQDSVHEFVVQTADAREVPVLMHVVPAAGSEDSLDRVLAAVIDISARKTAELRLAEREERLSAILDTVVDGIVSVDRAGTVRELNAAAERLFRCKSTDAAGEPLQRFLRPGPADADSEDVMSVLMEHVGTGHANACLCEGIRADGESFATEVSGSEVDHLGLYVLLIRDLSERRELQRQIIETSSEEQQRIGRDIHDGLGQELAAAAMMASALASKLEGAGVAEAAQARNVVTQIERALKESKAVSKGLAPLGTKAEELLDDLRALAAQIERSGELTCSFRYDEALKVTDSVIASNLYRIAQEALSNAVRHGKPSQITLELMRRDGRVRLMVRDNGRWVERRERGGGGLGLQIMGYRAAMLGGTLTVRPLDEGGTLLQCDIPLR